MSSLPRSASVLSLHDPPLLTRMRGYATDGAQPALALANGLRIRHVNGSPRGEGKQLVNGQIVQGFVAATLGVPQMRGAQGIRHLQQRMLPVDDWLYFVYVYRREARPPLAQCVDQRTFRDNRRATGIDQQRGRLHAGQVGCCDDAT